MSRKSAVVRIKESLPVGGTYHPCPCNEPLGEMWPSQDRATLPRKAPISLHQPQQPSSAQPSASQAPPGPASFAARLQLTGNQIQELEASDSFKHRVESGTTDSCAECLQTAHRAVANTVHCTYTYTLPTRGASQTSIPSGTHRYGILKPDTTSLSHTMLTAPSWAVRRVYRMTFERLTADAGYCVGGHTSSPRPYTNGAGTIS